MPKAFLVVLFLATITLVGVFKSRENDISNDAVITLIQNCNLGKESCVVELSNQSYVAFELLPFPLKPLEPIYLGALTSNSNILIVKSWFEGVTMEMGSHFLLPDVAQVKKENNFSFVGMIPVCTIDEKMTWRLIIEVENESTRYQIAFNLDVVKT